MKPKTKQQLLKESMNEFATKLASEITQQMSEFMTKHWELMLEIWISEREGRTNEN